ncbi:hypothetical protein ANN_21945 [Periplaneta americana]|uniref:Uncharacterized protein n=1 Tax=Periplaneta americana TaxID=6978 RepID=A0ABQ8S7E9_PERAM|nr:hypothetical protein ANN_21945 [Periplaneta americana]
MDLREVGYDDRDWINLAQDRDRWRAYVRAAMNLRVPQKPFVSNRLKAKKERLEQDKVKRYIKEGPKQKAAKRKQEEKAKEYCETRKLHNSLRNKGWIVEEEISCLAENGSTRRVDILAYNADTKQGIIVDPTIRFEVECHQSAEVHLEKKSIYEPTVNYFKLKYGLIHVEVFGLLIGARGTIPAFFEEFRR